MTCQDPYQINIKTDAPLRRTLRWETGPIVWRPITAITQTAPVLLTVPAHGCPPGWRVDVESVQGMKEINGWRDTNGNQPTATLVGADAVELNAINAAGFKPYTSGGYLKFNTPVDMTGMTARLRVWDRQGGSLMLELDHTNAVTIDTAGYSITYLITLEQMTNDLGDRPRFYIELDMIDSLGDPHQLVGANVIRSDS